MAPPTMAELTCTHVHVHGRVGICVLAAHPFTYKNVTVGVIFAVIYICYGPAEALCVTVLIIIVCM